MCLNQGADRWFMMAWSQPDQTRRSAMSTAKSSSESLSGMPGDIVKSMQSGMANMMAIPQKVMEANLETGAELLSFMSRRMKSQSDLWSRIGHCHGMDEAADAQRLFVESLTKDYTEEMGQLADVFRKNLETVTSAVSDQFSQSGALRKNGPMKH
jgi:hypothetical protein